MYNLKKIMKSTDEGMDGKHRAIRLTIVLDDIPEELHGEIESDISDFWRKLTSFVPPAQQ